MALVVAAERSVDVFRVQRRAGAAAGVGEAVAVGGVLARALRRRGQHGPGVSWAAWLVCLVVPAGSSRLGLLLRSLSQVGQHEGHGLLEAEQPSVHLVQVLQAQTKLVCVGGNLHRCVTT